MRSNAFYRRTGDNSADAPIYLASVNDLRETGRAIGVSLLGVDPSGPALFLPTADGDFQETWNRWLTESFEKRLGETFVEIFVAAGEMRNRRIAELDRLIDSRLFAKERERSLSAAVPFFEGTSEIQRLPQWTKFLEKIKSGETPGHVISLFALRSAVFHLPLLPSLVSYLYFEWKSGFAALETSGEILTPETFQSRYPGSVETARRLFGTGPGTNGLESI